MTYGKFHDTIILKIQAIYDNVTKIENSIRASEIVDINEMAPESYISEDIDVKKEELQQRSFYIWYENEIELWTERRWTLEMN